MSSAAKYLETVLHTVITVPFMTAILAGGAAFLVAFVAFVIRAFYFLKSGYWILSACGVTFNLSWSGFNVPNACQQFSFEWIGVNILLRWALVETDISLSAIIVGAGLIACGLVWLFGIALVTRNGS